MVTVHTRSYWWTLGLHIKARQQTDPARRRLLLLVLLLLLELLLGLLELSLRSLVTAGLGRWDALAGGGGTQLFVDAKKCADPL